MIYLHRTAVAVLTVFIFKPGSLRGKRSVTPTEESGVAGFKRAPVGRGTTAENHCFQCSEYCFLGNVAVGKDLPPVSGLFLILNFSLQGANLLLEASTSEGLYSLLPSGGTRESEFIIPDGLGYWGDQTVVF